MRIKKSLGYKETSKLYINTFHYTKEPMLYVFFSPTSFYWIIRLLSVIIFFFSLIFYQLWIFLWSQAFSLIILQKFSNSLFFSGRGNSLLFLPLYFLHFFTNDKIITFKCPKTLKGIGSTDLRTCSWTNTKLYQCQICTDFPSISAKV